MKRIDKIKTIVIDDESHWQLILTKMVGKESDLSLEGAFSSVEEAEVFLTQNHIDLIFLDVQINESNGIEWLKQLNRTHTVIIVSSFKEFALEGYSISAVDYLTKPIDADKFDEAVEKAIAQVRAKDSFTTSPDNISFDREYFLIKESLSTFKITYSEVYAISALENYIKIITLKKTYVVLATLLQFERSITNHPFLRVHRSYIVNINYIKVLHKDTLTLSNDLEIPLGDVYKDQIQEVFVEGKLIKRI
jgi:DNA-binding LytR/AlgR family response regulator